MTHEDAKDLIYMFDENEDGVMQIDEFVNAMKFMAIGEEKEVDELADAGILRAPIELTSHKLSPKLASRPTHYPL